ncbi:DUF1702 family protein [Nocardiopsis dassonvillei]|uniref:DUF1702 family protein n=1 Tax=Nocardiopsis dassonvillei TaxID=2014 RepID=UPI0036FCF66F
MLDIPIEETTFARRGFHRGAPEAVRALEDAAAAFHHGYATALAAPAEAAESFPPQSGPRAGFVYEGAAMALCLSDALSAPSRNDFTRFLALSARTSPYTSYVGAGWALARLPAPLRRPVLRQLDPLLGWLAWDGHGFHDLFFGRAGRPGQSFTGYVRNAVAQGRGRALWFTCCADPERVALAVRRHPGNHAGDLWSGIALAAVFAGGAPEGTGRLRALAEDHTGALAQGAAFAAKALLTLGDLPEHSGDAVRELCGTEADRAARIVDEEWVRLPPARPGGRPRQGPPAYELWRRAVAARLVEEDARVR